MAPQPSQIHTTRYSLVLQTEKTREGFYIDEVEEYEAMFCKLLSPVLMTVRSVVCTSELILKL